MQSRYPGIQTNALAAVMNLSIPNNNKIQIASAGAIPVLIKLLKSRSDLAQELITGALSNLALNDDNKMAIGVLGAVPPLLHVLRVGSQGAQRDAAMALYQLSFSQNNCVKLIKAGAVGILLPSASGGLRSSEPCTTSIVQPGCDSRGTVCHF